MTGRRRGYEFDQIVVLPTVPTTDEPAANAGQVKLTAMLLPKVYASLEAAAQREGFSRTAVLNRAIRLYDEVTALRTTDVGSGVVRVEGSFDLAVLPPGGVRIRRVPWWYRWIGCG